MDSQLKQVPGFLFFDHVAISVKPGELEAHVSAYRTLGFREVHREDVLGGDQVREVLAEGGGGPNPGQALGAVERGFPGFQADREERRPWRVGARGAARSRYRQGVR